MLWIGFAYLLAFLGRYAYGTITMNMMLGVLVFQWGILVNGFFGQVTHSTFHSGDAWSRIRLNMPAFINADFAVAAVLVSFGGVLGKLSPFQYVMMALIEIPFYGVVNYVGLELFKCADIGGSMFIHSFGAYFGLAVARFVARPDDVNKHPKNSETYKSDTFSMIGTIFLWMFWPSFNAALGVGAQQQRAVLNTTLSLCGSCLMVFVFSQLIRGKFKMVDIQNATLAGGVAIGACANLIVYPYGALLIGCIAGVVSTLGFTFIQPFLERRIKLFDTAGIHNLHGMPGVFGGIAGIVMALFATSVRYGNDGVIAEHYLAMRSLNATQIPLVDGVEDYPLLHLANRTPGMQAGFQAAGLLMTLGIALGAGALTGKLLSLKICDPPRKQNYFDDLEYFEVPARVIVEAEDNVVVHPISVESRDGSVELKLTDRSEKKSTSSSDGKKKKMKKMEPRMRDDKSTTEEDKELDGDDDEEEEGQKSSSEGSEKEDDD
jgi:ammonium transporter Rh